MTVRRSRLLAVVAAAVSVAAVHAPAGPVAAGSRPLVIAHSGAAGLWPENTMFAFRRAWALGADVLDFDVKVTSDGVPVVFHDPDLSGTTDCSGLVAETAWRDVRRCDAAYRFTRDGGRTYPYRGRGLRVPRLADLIAFAKPRGIPLGAELANNPTEADFSLDAASAVAPTARVVGRTGSASLLLFSSFWPPNLDAMRAEVPGARYALLTEGRVDPEQDVPPGSPRFPCLSNLLFSVARGYDEIQPDHETPDIPECVRAAHAAGVRLSVWTVDDRAGMVAMVEAGVDGIITNRPDRLLRLLRGG